MTQKSKPPLSEKLPLPLELIKRRICIVRGQEVMLDSDLAELYQVETFNLNKAVKRNLSRFPADFMFKLTAEQYKILRFQIGISKLAARGGRRYLPYAFTEHGVAMLSSVLKSTRAIKMNVFIIRAFIQMRQMLASQQQLSKRLQKTENILKLHDEVLISLVEDVKRIKNPSKINLIGFHWKPKSKL